MHTNQKILVDLLLKNGATIETVDSFEELIEVNYKGQKELLLDRFSSKMPFNVVKITADKFLTKQILLKNKILVPNGSIFYFHKYDEAFKFAQKNYPIVLKPNWGSHGDYIYSNIENDDELKTAIFSFTEKNSIDTPFILEKYYPWKEYRLFITKNGDFSVIHRDCASVIGNNTDTIEELITQENIQRTNHKLNNPSSLCPIVIDEEVHTTLNKNNLTLKSIPLEKEKIYLRHESNLVKGGISIDYTDKIHLEFKSLALSVLNSFPGLVLAGIDVLINDINNIDNGYVVLEVNSNPGLAMHTYPHIGDSQPVGQYVLDVMFD